MSIKTRYGACGALRFSETTSEGPVGYPATYTVWLGADPEVSARVSCYGAAYALRLAARQHPKLEAAYAACPTARRRAYSGFWGESQKWNEPDIVWLD